MLSNGERCLLMFSVDEVLSLVDKTEKNLKIAEHLTKLFVVPVLNEWRYGTRHIVTALKNGCSDAEFKKSMGHWKRAYFDSCDIVVDCILKRCADMNRRYYGYTDIVQSVVPRYCEYLAEMRDIQKRHLNAKLESDETGRMTAYDDLSSILAKCDEMLSEIDKHEIPIVAKVRRAKVKHRLGVAAAIATVVGAIIPLAAKLVGCIF